jgi:hypothetical protein
MSSITRASGRFGDGIVTEAAKNRRENYFRISSRNPLSTDRNASQTARITRQPIRTHDVERTARTIDALENARRNVGRATILDRFASQRSAGRHGMRVASYHRRVTYTGMRDRAGVMRGAVGCGR